MDSALTGGAAYNAAFGGFGQNGNDDENSQAEGLNSEAGAVGYQQATGCNNGSNNNNSNVIINNNVANNNINVHYENIYESIEQYAGVNAGVAAVAPAAALQNSIAPQAIPGPSVLSQAQRIAAAVGAPPPPPSMLQMQQQYHPLAYRNELYDRTAGYDVPRGGRGNYYQSQGSLPSGGRCQNLHLDLNRIRYQPTQQRTPRQRSFDDTESYHYYRYQNQNTFNSRFDNVYERVREEPAYQNTGSFSQPNRGLYGRLDVIGHGVGRIERHLSSSCGNIDHYSLGGHYAVMGHSHLGTVGHIRLNQSPNNNQPNTSKDSTSVNVKSFFSCLGGENSQSMNNISKSGIVGGSAAAAGSDASSFGLPNGAPSSMVPSSSATGTERKVTGTIPKIRKSKQTQQTQPQELSDAPDTATIGGRVTKPSLQWLLVNKWLPLWVGQTPPDYKFIDFNFMFSRNCDGCAGSGNAHPPQELVRYGDQADYIPPAREYPTMNGSYPRVLRNTPQLSRLREHEYENVPLESPATGSSPFSVRAAPLGQPLRERSESPARSSSNVESRHEDHPSCNSGDPFRRWAFNFEDNSFRPARSAADPKPRDIRRITDGTFRTKDFLPDDERPGPSGLQGSGGGGGFGGTASGHSTREARDETSRCEGDKDEESELSSDSDNFAIESVTVEAGGPAEDSSQSGDGARAYLDGRTMELKDRETVSSSVDSSEASNLETENDAADRSLSEDEIDPVAKVVIAGAQPEAETN